MDIPEVRRRLRAAIEEARRQAEARRIRNDAAARDYEVFLEQRAVPLFHTVAAVLVAEGHQFKVFTPANSVRLASQRSNEDFIELALDTESNPPAVLGRISRARGRGGVSSERPVGKGTAVADLTEEDVLSFVLDEIAPFVER
jgi:hypothetical protein